MAIWVIQQKQKRVALTYAAGLKQPAQSCGSAALTDEAALEAWVADQSRPFDIIVTRHGMFVRQTGATQKTIGWA